ncbi:MAG: DUF4445 domain-containing protein [Deltaproteobacteria bacterium]|nr:DUF4445 domain-containing protein [Deltaproteobacteria bacterium]
MSEIKKPCHEEGWVRSVPLLLDPPSLKDNTADVDRLIRGIKRCLGVQTVTVSVPLVRRVPEILRASDYRVHALLHEEDGRGIWHLMDLLPDSAEVSLAGVALDLGTSTIVARLVDLQTGHTRGEVSFLNPQISVGPDILTRIHHAGRPGGLHELQGKLVQKLNQEVGRLCSGSGIRSTEIVAASVAGNTTMTHLFLGLDPHWICREPYIPVLNVPGLMKAEDVGFSIHGEAPVLVFPNVGSYLGGDLIAGILASGMHRRDDLSILVDVGTNAEVVLGNRDWLMACAGAAGPALEGGVAAMGMMAAPGVIDRVVMDPAIGEFRLRTIENKPPVGICGSGLIDLVAQLFLAGMIDVRGKFVREKCGERLKEVDGIRHFVVVPAEDSGTGSELTLAQTDLDALIRSKAAMFTILSTVTGMVHLSMREIRNFHVAGTFGSYINPASAITLGMIPDLPLETFRSLGNTSLAGATEGLISSRARREVRMIRDRVTYLELNVNQEFMNLFNAARFIPHTDRSLFPSVRRRTE